MIPQTQRKTIKLQKYQSIVFSSSRLLKKPHFDVVCIWQYTDVDVDDVTHIVPHTAERPSLMWCVCGF